ncbi:MAG: dethiobiotin synthase [Holophagaceae bacterium]|nr:dethiobiotin synthase [Holophagaceae bacterium]
MNAALFQTLPDPLWVLGTDTGVGKTWVAGAIARAWAAAGPVVYRKPFQTGVPSAADPGADATAVAGPGVATETGITLEAPLSPMAAAELEGRSLDLDALAAWALRPAPGCRVLLEGVGGVLVPLAPGRHFLAWASDLHIPAVLVAQGGLGTLNHTLLSCEALMLRGWRIEAVLLNPGLDGSREAAVHNAAVLRRFLPFPIHILE